MNQPIYMLSDDGIKKLTEQITSTILTALESSNNPTDDHPMDIDETSKMIHLAKPTIYGLTHRNSIPFHKQGKKLYFLKSEIMDWIKNGKGASKPADQKELHRYLHANKLY